MIQTSVLSSAAVTDAPVMLPTESVNVAAKVVERIAKEKFAAEEAEKNNITSEEREGMVAQLNKTLDAFDTRVSLSLDEKSRQNVIKVIDNESGKVVRQIPSEQLMRISERITELLGVIYDEKM